MNHISFQKKLASYSAITGVMIAIGNHTEAQIIYQDISPDVELDSLNNIYLLDMDNDGVFDFKFSYKQTYLGLGASSYGKITPYNSSEVLAYIDDVPLVAIISPGDTICEIPPYPSYGWMNNEIALFTYDVAHYGEMGWVNTVGRFAGVILKETDGKHYGWVRITHQSNVPLIIEDYAYQSQPNTCIGAGEQYPTQVNNPSFTDELFNVSIVDRSIVLHFDPTLLPSLVMVVNEMGQMVHQENVTQEQTMCDNFL